VLAGLQDAEDLGVRKDGGHRVEAAGERLADERDVRLDAFVLLGEQPAGSAEARLDLVEDQGDVALRAQRTHLAEIAGRRNDDAGLALDRLHEKRDRVVVEGLGERLEVAERHDPKPWSKRAEAATRVRVGAESDDRERAAVKVVGADDDLRAVRRHALDLVAPLAHGLERGLDRLGAAVHRQDLVRARQLREILVEQGELVVAERPRRERELLCLLDHGGEDPGMAVALVERGVGRQAVEVALALVVPDPHAAAAHQHHVERLVVVGPERGLDRDQVLGRRIRAHFGIKHCRCAS
jgi:hypothetical protein